MFGCHVTPGPCPVHACRYMGAQGVYTHTVQYEKDLECPICSMGTPLTVQPGMSLQQVGPWLDFRAPLLCKIIVRWEHSRCRSFEEIGWSLYVTPLYEQLGSVSAGGHTAWFW